MESESGATRSIIDELHFLHIQQDQVEREGGVRRSIMDELHSWDIKGDEIEDESMVLLEVSSLNFIFGI